LKDNTREQGGTVQNNHDAKSPDTNGSGPVKGPGPDYSPKELTLRQQVIFFLKLLAIFGTCFIFFWWFEK